MPGWSLSPGDGWGCRLAGDVSGRLAFRLGAGRPLEAFDGPDGERPTREPSRAGRIAVEPGEDFRQQRFDATQGGDGRRIRRPRWRLPA